jgi:hypothetical protein
MMGVSWCMIWKKKQKNEVIKMGIKNELKVLEKLYFISKFWHEKGVWFVEVDSDQGNLFLQLMGFEEIKKLPME